MRQIGPYATGRIPTFAALVAESTPDRKAAMTPLIPAVVSACADYDAVAPAVHNLNPIPLQKLDREALIDGYDGRTTAMKRLISKMLACLPAADGDLCPYCSLDTNPDLDHFLPKAVFPEFALHAPNLIPICTPCNRKKLNAIKTKISGDRLFLHPSAEPSRNTILIEAIVTISLDAIKIEYEIDDAGSLPPEELALVKRHFGRLSLRERYARRALSHMSSFKVSIKGHQRAAVRRALHSKITNPEFGEPVNGWRPALYRALARQEKNVLNWLLY